MQLDHLLMAVPDLEIAARVFRDRCGLTAVEGGRHPGWGTANRIVPLGDTYIELVTVVDAGQAAGSTFGRWVAGRLEGGGGLLGWAVRAEDFEGTVARLGLTTGSGSRRTADGRELRWRMAGVEEAAAEPCLPFFLEWAPGTPFPGGLPVDHPGGLRRWRGLRVAGDPDRIEQWTGGGVDVDLRPGAPAVLAAVLDGDGGELVIDGEVLDKPSS